MTEISLSNSLIESWWRAIKHQWLYLNTLDTVSTLEKLVAFYVDEHTMRLPHWAFARDFDRRYGVCGETSIANATGKPWCATS